MLTANLPTSSPAVVSVTSSTAGPVLAPTCQPPTISALSPASLIMKSPGLAPASVIPTSPTVSAAFILPSSVNIAREKRIRGGILERSKMASFQDLPICNRPKYGLGCKGKGKNYVHRCNFLLHGNTMCLAIIAGQKCISIFNYCILVNFGHFLTNAIKLYIILFVDI
jgi:hypothetical protein